MKPINVHTLIQGAINKSPSTVEKSFQGLVKREILSRIEVRRAEIGSNLMNKPKSEDTE